MATLTHPSGELGVVAATGRVEAVLADAGTVAAVVATPTAIRLLVLDRRTGRQRAAVPIDAVGPVAGLSRLPAGYLAVGAEQAAVVDPATARVTLIELPGRVAAVPHG
jgi:hypothetical protein